MLVNFFKKTFVLKAAFYSHPNFTFQTPPTEEFLGNFANFHKSVITESLCKKCVVYILNVLFIKVLTDSFLLFTNILFKMLELNPVCYKKKPYVKI